MEGNFYKSKYHVFDFFGFESSQRLLNSKFKNNKNF